MILIIAKELFYILLYPVVLN